jgi:hypothetical protein
LWAAPFILYWLQSAADTKKGRTQKHVLLYSLCLDVSVLMAFIQKGGGGKMYVHRTSNGKHIPQYTCGAYSKTSVGTRCPTQHRINA